MNQNGDVYQSNLSSYYKSEEEALEAIKGDMEETIERYESDIEELQVRLQAHRNYLEELENEA
jgi:prefoldin subunit 5